MGGSRARGGGDGAYGSLGKGGGAGRDGAYRALGKGAGGRFGKGCRASLPLLPGWGQGFGKGKRARGLQGSSIVLSQLVQGKVSVHLTGVYVQVGASPGGGGSFRGNAFAWDFIVSRVGHIFYKISLDVNRPYKKLQSKPPGSPLGTLGVSYNTLYDAEITWKKYGFFVEFQTFGWGNRKPGGNRKPPWNPGALAYVLLIWVLAPKD
jgi:hypothetical protein